MNNTAPVSFIPDLLRDLRAFAAVGEEALALAAREHQALAGAANYEPFEFYSLRKDLLIRLEPLMMEIKHWRQLWQQISPLERGRCPDVNGVIQMLQNLLVKILQLDRENQQALLRRGLVPARHVTSCAAPPPNYVANLYRRHNPH
jgi:hypothetical protein